MNLFGKEVSQRESVLLIATLAIAVVALVYWVGMGSGSASDSPDEVMESLGLDASRFRSNLKQANELRKEMALGDFELTGTEESPKVHLHIETTARGCGLGFPALTASAAKKGKGFQTIGYRLKATSEMKALVKFIDQIQSGKYLICLESWNMKPTNDPKNIETDLALRAYFKPVSRKGKR